MAKYTDEQVKKALEEELKTALIVNHRFETVCDTENPDDHRFIALLSNTIKLINRQEAEIESLKEEIKTTERNVLISFANVLVMVYSYQPITPEKKKVVDVDVIVSLVKNLTGKEMVGESK